MDIDSLYSDKKKYFIFDIDKVDGDTIETMTRFVDISHIKDVSLKKEKYVGHVSVSKPFYVLTFSYDNLTYTLKDKRCIWNILNYFTKFSICIDPNTVRSIKEFMDYYNKK